MDGTNALTLLVALQKVAKRSGYEEIGNHRGDCEGKRC